VVVAAGLAIVFVVVGAIFTAQRTDPHGLPVNPPAWSGFGGWNLLTAIVMALGISFALLGAEAVAYLIYSRRRHKDDEDESNDRKT
jgi:amino acid transporter